MIEACMSVLAQRFTDASLGELVLAHDALGVDPQRHVHAVPGPLGYLGRVDAAIEPRGQAGVPEVIWAPGERGGLLRSAQSRLARFDPGATVGDGRQFATPDTAEETVIRRSTELVQMLAQKASSVRDG